MAASNIDDCKQLKREKRHELREKILKDAREDYERKKIQEEKRRVENKWIAPGVSERLGLDSSERSRKRKKKSKKEHKRNKPKKLKHLKEDVESEDSDSVDDVWVERDTTNSVDTMKDKDAYDMSVPLQRDEWMSKPIVTSVLSMCSDRAEKQNEESKTQKETKLSSFDTPGQHPLELNPFWKEGGSGLPQELETFTKSKPSSSKVNDGGRSWILRSYKRALEQAEAEGKSLEDIANARWGSLEKLYSLLHSAGIDPEDPDGGQKKERREYLHSSASHSSSKHSPRGIDQHGAAIKQVPHSHKLKDQSSRGSYLKPGEASHIMTSSAQSELTSAGNWRIKKEMEEHSCKEDVETELSEHVHAHTCMSSVTDTSSLQMHEQTPIQADSISLGDAVTDSKLNLIAAKLMKAELLGDEQKIKDLKNELDSLRKLKEEQVQSHVHVHVKDNHKSQKKTVMLATTDRFGRYRPMESNERYSKRTFPEVSTRYSKKGKQKRVYDEDGISLKSMIQEERRMTAEDTHAAIAQMASKFVPAANSEETVDDALDSKKATRYDAAKEKKAQRDRAIFEGRKMTEMLEKCQFCFGNPNFNNHLLIAVGIGVYLTVPSHQSLTEGHCLLVPMEHTTCSLQLDENVWSEVQIFQKGLTRMFSDLDMDVIFTESYMSTAKKSHMYIECIAMPKEEGSLAPMYFKKAIQESDVEWSENKKLIDTRQKGVRNSIPVGLPYFFVDFGMDGGYAHIIEDQSKFPNYFAREIVGGILDVEPRLWLKPPKQSFEHQKMKVNKFSEWWQPYDWTQKLKQN